MHPLPPSRITIRSGNTPARLRGHLRTTLLCLLCMVQATSPAQDTPDARSASGDIPSSLVQDLLNRIRDLERREAERASAGNRNAEDTIRQLQHRITELESKVQSLETAQVFPEIILPADDTPSTSELDQKLRVIERKNELAAEAAEARQKEAPIVSIGSSGFTFSSADTNFVLKVRGIVQGDTRTFFDDNTLSEGNEGFFLRRARPIIEGTVFRDFDYQFVPDFGGSSVQIFDANITYRLQPEVRFKVGKFKSPVGYEHLLQDANLGFNERSFVSTLVPSRQIGFQTEGDVFQGRLSYAAGVFNSTGDGKVAGNADFGDEPEFAARLSFRPFSKSGNEWLRGLDLGVSGSYSQISSNLAGLPSSTGGTRPGYTTPGLQQFYAYNSPSGNVVADGVHWRFAPHATYLRGPFGFLGEYILTGQSVLNATTLRRDELNHTAWQVAAQWVLTGEPASFTGIAPLRPFRPADGAWGAWQLVARYSVFDADDDSFQGFSSPLTSATGANSWAVGINWWLNRNLRLLTSFSLTSFDGGGSVSPADPTTQIPPGTITHQDEKALFTRLQLAF